MPEKLQGTVRIRLNQNVTLENLHSLIDRITNLSGCRACGLGGIDLRLTGDPAELREVAKLPGVESVRLGQ